MKKFLFHKLKIKKFPPSIKTSAVLFRHINDKLFHTSVQWALLSHGTRGEANESQLHRLHSMWVFPRFFFLRVLISCFRECGVEKKMRNFKLKHSNTNYSPHTITISFAYSQCDYEFTAARLLSRWHHCNRPRHHWPAKRPAWISRALRLHHADRRDDCDNSLREARPFRRIAFRSDDGTDIYHWLFCHLSQRECKRKQNTWSLMRNSIWFGDDCWVLCSHFQTYCLVCILSQYQEYKSGYVNSSNEYIMVS